MARNGSLLQPYSLLHFRATAPQPRNVRRTDLREEALGRLRQRDDVSQRYYAAWWLGRTRTNNPEGLSLLLDALSAALHPEASPDDLLVARNAARALGKLCNQEAAVPLSQALQHPDHALREAAARALGELGNPALLPELLHQLMQPDAAKPSSDGLHLQQPCEALLEAIGCLARGTQDAELCRKLEPFSGHERLLVQSSACRALLQISEAGQWGERILPLLNHPEPLIRRGALLDLGASGWRPAAEAIAGCAAESSLKLLALRTLLESPLGLPAPAALGPSEQELLALMDRLL